MKFILGYFVLLYFISFFNCSSLLSKPMPRLCGWYSEASNDSGSTNATEEEIIRNLKFYKSKGIECVNYWTDLPKYPRAAKIAQKLGLQFYAWLPAMLGLGENKKFLFENHPEAYVVTKSGIHAHETPIYGAPHYKFLCPNNPIVRNYLKEMYNNISKIPEVDGINLDYVRYIEQNYWIKYKPDGDTCYCNHCVSSFLKKTGMNITKHKHPYKVKKWADYRVSVITSFVNEIAEIVHSNGKRISADVYPGPGLSTIKTRQKWEDWNIDMVFPMIYTDVFKKNTEWIGQQTREGKVKLKLQKNRKKPMLYTGLQAEAMSDKDFRRGVELAYENGAHGICVFKLSNINEEKFDI